MAAFDTYWNNVLSTWKPFWIIHAIASQSASDILVLLYKDHWYLGKFTVLNLRENIVNEPHIF